MGVRHRARELALQMLYQRELSGSSVEHMLAHFEELQQAPEAARQYAVALVRGVLDHLEEIDAQLEAQADHWRLERMAVVDRNVLRLGLYELLFEPETPHAVVIDEAVELAKRFGSENSGPFVNGLLDGFRRRLQKATG